MSKQDAVAPAEVLDPVCGMTISPDDAVGHVEHDGQTYYFCNESCLERFQADPEAFLGGERPVESPTPPGTTYICPMDPEVRQQGPGACPKCGMALEPDLATLTSLDDGPHPELVDMTRRFRIAALLG